MKKLVLAAAIEKTDYNSEAGRALNGSKKYCLTVT